MSKLGKKKILIAYASTGSGHKIAAEAIYEEFLNNDEDINIVIADILDYFPQNESGSKFVNFTTGLLSPVFDLTWRTNFTGRILWGGGQLWPSLLYKNFEHYIAGLNPDVVVCTHFVCANVAAKVRANKNLNFRIVSVPTDYETEGLWPHKETDLFCVGSEEMASTLQSRRVDRSKILVSGIPISSEFSNKYSKLEVKKLFSIKQNKKVVLIICGANDSGPYKNMRKTLNECLSFFSKMDWLHFVFCVGQDEAYANKLSKLANNVNASNFTILTYTDKLPQLMSIADIAIVKPGGLIVSECINMNLPMILIGKAYAQENLNRRFLISNGAAVHATTYKGVINFLCDIFTYPNWYTSLKFGLSKIRRANSSKKICSEVVEHIDESHIEKPKLWNNIYLGKKPIHSR